MKTFKLLVATGLTLGMSASAFAAPKGIDNLLSRLVTQAVTITMEELNNEVTESVLNTAYHYEDAVPNTKIVITALPSSDKNEESE